MLQISRSHVLAALAAGMFVAGTAQADFSGQTILGPLTDGSAVSGDTTGKGDENDGFTSGFVFAGIWDGGDDVWQINWGGGSLKVDLLSLGGSDNDLFLYTPSSYDDSANYSIVGAFDTVTEVGAPAGIYYVVVDTTFFSEGRYNLTVSPSPSALGLAGLSALVLGGRRRR